MFSSSKGRAELVAGVLEGKVVLMGGYGDGAELDGEVLTGGCTVDMFKMQNFPLWLEHCALFSPNLIPI